MFTSRSRSILNSLFTSRKRVKAFVFHFALLEKEWKHFFFILHFSKKSESFLFSLFTSRTSKTHSRWSLHYKRLKQCKITFSYYVTQKKYCMWLQVLLLIISTIHSLTDLLYNRLCQIGNEEQLLSAYWETFSNSLWELSTLGFKPASQLKVTFWKRNKQDQLGVALFSAMASGC